MSEPRDFGKRPELTWLPADRLDVDQTYQRSLDTVSGARLIKKIVLNFNWASFQAILATPTDGDRWLIIDGQHRVSAAKQCRITLVPAVVVHDADRAAQSVAFVAANRDRVAVSTQAVFHARVAAGDMDAIAVTRICAAAGIEILAYNHTQRELPPRKTTATTGLLSMLRVHGEKITAEAIAAVAECYGGETGGLRAPFFMAAGLFLQHGGASAMLRRSLVSVGSQRLIAINIAGGPLVMAREICVLLERAAAGATPAPAHEPAKRVPVASDAVAPFRAPQAAFRDDPRARADHGSREHLGRPEPFGRSSTGSSLA